MLPLETRLLIDDLLQAKDDEIRNRNDNASEVAMLRFKCRKEKDYQTRFELRKAIAYGDELIRKQNKVIAELSISSIAKKLEVSRGRVSYYEKTTYTPISANGIPAFIEGNNARAALRRTA